MQLDRSELILAPVPRDVEYLGTVADRVYYHYGGTIWAWTAIAWFGVCLFTEWPRRPEARVIAAQGH